MNLKLILLISFLFLCFTQWELNNISECISEEKENNFKEIRIQCSEKEEPSDNEPDPILIKTCIFGIFQSVRTGTADYKGRYSYEYELFMIENDKKKEIRNSDLFISGSDLVEKRINQDLQEEYKKNLNNPHLKACMEWIDFRYYELDEMGMAFTYDNEIEFHVDYGIGGACFNVAHSTLKYKLSEFAQYLD